jgi:hypothetical protein
LSSSSKRSDATTTFDRFLFSRETLLRSHRHDRATPASTTTTFHRFHHPREV